MPLLPWLFRLADSWAAGHAAFRWDHLFEGKFWIRWATEPLGLSLEYSLERDFVDFIRYPLLAGRPTFAVGLLHGLLVVAGAAVFVLSAWQSWLGRAALKASWAGRGSQTDFIWTVGNRRDTF